MSFERVCNLYELALDTGVEFVVSGKVVALFRTEQAIYALDGMCAHQGGPLAQGVVRDGCVTCPWHGWQYDMSTGNNLLTRKKMLACYPVEIRGQEIWIDTRD